MPITTMDTVLRNIKTIENSLSFTFHKLTSRQITNVNLPMFNT